MKQFFRRILPPLAYDALRWCLRPEARRPAREPVLFSGNFAGWREAQSASTGYNAPVILEKTKSAMLKIKQGEALFERDGLLLPSAETPLPLLAGLLRAATENNGRLHVLDFGGALGSSYFQCRQFLAPLPHVRWSVVEQPAHVACGAVDFADEHLQFFLDVSSAFKSGHPDVLLLSSVLQYLPEPTATLADLLAHRFKYVVVDRTLFHSGVGNRLTVQRVPEWIYPASYPAWFFSEPDFRSHFVSGYEWVADFEALDQPSLPDAHAYAKGMIFRLRS